ncbi:hypothetical protein PSAC2689_80232 [Paraburkholderia sacchari]
MPPVITVIILIMKRRLNAEDVSAPDAMAETAASFSNEVMRVSFLCGMHQSRHAAPARSGGRHNGAIVRFMKDEGGPGAKLRHRCATWF